MSLNVKRGLSDHMAALPFAIDSHTTVVPCVLLPDSSSPPCSVARSIRPTAEDAAKKADWVQLFNGKDLTGWKPKIRYHDLGDNYANTFRVEDGLLKVRYDGYEKFNETFGHLFHETGLLSLHPASRVPVRR